MSRLYPLPRIFLLCCLSLCLGCATSEAPPADARLEALRARLPGLQSRIEAWRGSEFLRPVELDMREPEQEHIAGWYESRTDRLYVAPRAKGRFLEGVLLHELVHALQDQRFDLDATRKRLGEAEEAAEAFSALIEGEAMLAVVELLGYDFEKHARRAQTDGAARTGALFVYGDGLRFIRAVRASQGWEGVDASFRAPPRTREQILDPAGYLENVH